MGAHGALARVLCVVACVAACTDTDSEPSGDDGGSMLDADAADATHPPRDAAASSDALNANGDATARADAGVPAACGLPGPEPLACDAGTTEPLLYLLWDARSAMPADSDLVPGIDIDREVSDDRDADTCFRTDHASPAPGSPAGVDNQVGLLLDNLSLTDSVDRDLEDSLLAGEVVLLLEIRGLDDPTNDPCVGVLVHRGSYPGGRPEPLSAVTLPGAPVSQKRCYVNFRGGARRGAS
jgi:hypothetical protein